MTGAPARAALVFLLALNLSLAPSGGIAHAAELVQPGYLIAGDTYGYSVSTGGAVVGDSKDAAVGLGTLGGANSQANAASDDLDLWAWAAWSHRFERRGPSMDGDLIGMSRFSYGGGPVDQDWAEVGGGFKYKPNRHTETFSRITFALGNEHYAAPDIALTTGVAWDF